MTDNNEGFIPFINDYSSKKNEEYNGITLKELEDFMISMQNNLTQEYKYERCISGAELLNTENNVIFMLFATDKNTICYTSAEQHKLIQERIKKLKNSKDYKKEWNEFIKNNK